MGSMIWMESAQPDMLLSAEPLRGVYLYFLSGSLEKRCLVITEPGEYSLGRGKDNDIILGDEPNSKDKRVSRKGHVVLQVAVDSVHVKPGKIIDENGEPQPLMTYIGSTPLALNENAPLHDRGVVTLGEEGVAIQFRFSDFPFTDAQDPSMLQHAPAKPYFDKQRQARMQKLLDDAIYNVHTDPLTWRSGFYHAWRSTTTNIAVKRQILEILSVRYSKSLFSLVQWCIYDRNNQQECHSYIMDEMFKIEPNYHSFWFEQYDGTRSLQHYINGVARKIIKRYLKMEKRQARISLFDPLMTEIIDRAVEQERWREIIKESFYAVEVAIDDDNERAVWDRYTLTRLDHDRISQKALGEELGISQSEVSRIVGKLNTSLKEEIKKRLRVDAGGDKTAADRMFELYMGPKPVEEK